MPDTSEFLVRNLSGELVGSFLCPEGSSLRDLKQQVAKAVGQPRFQFALVAATHAPSSGGTDNASSAAQDFDSVALLPRELVCIRKVLRDSEEDWQCLAQAVESGDLRAVEAALETPILPQREDVSLLCGGAREDEQLLRLLLESVADPNFEVRGPADYMSPLMAAVAFGSVACLELLLTAGADPNRCDPAGEAPLLGVLRRGRREPRIATLRGRSSPYGQREVAVIKALLAHRADVTDPGLLGVALSTQRYDDVQHEETFQVMQLLVAAGAPPLQSPTALKRVAPFLFATAIGLVAFVVVGLNTEFTNLERVAGAIAAGTLAWFSIAWMALDEDGCCFLLSIVVANIYIGIINDRLGRSVKEFILSGLALAISIVMLVSVSRRIRFLYWLLTLTRSRGSSLERIDYQIVGQSASISA